MENITCWKQGKRVSGDLHLVPHHIVFHYPPRNPPPPDPARPHLDTPRRQGELWVAYPMIAFCTYRPSHPESRKPHSIRLRCRDFTFVAFEFHFKEEATARSVYDSIRSLTCKLGKIEKLYAFIYEPPKAEKEVNGWELYDIKREWKRQGVSEKDPDRGWRISQINTDYQVCTIRARRDPEH